MGNYDYDKQAGVPGARRRGWRLLLAVVAALVVVSSRLRLAVGERARSAPGRATIGGGTADDIPARRAVALRCHRPAGQRSIYSHSSTPPPGAVGALDPAALRQVLDEVRRLRDELQREVLPTCGWHSPL
jgi:hypothetical protein